MKNATPLPEHAVESLLAGLAGSESYVFLESTRVTPENHLSYLFLDPVTRLVCNPGDDTALFLGRAQEKLDRGFFLAGYLGYEFGYMLEPFLAKGFRPRPLSAHGSGMLPLADLGVFRAPYLYDHLAGSFAANGPWPAGESADPAAAFAIENLRLNQERKEYLEAIQRIKAYIASGDTYQVNYTLKLLFDFAGSLPRFYCTLRRNQGVSYSGLIKNGETAILSFSPELFFRKNDNRIDVRPMKGTMHRGRTVIEDAEFAGFLHHDIKNRSENVMIVDLLRNDLGRLSRMGGVQVQSLFDVETYETLHQMTSSIRGNVAGPLTLEKMFKALFPCGSVTGAPKIRTMEIIRELETEDRGVYTGAIGFMAPGGQAVFTVPIRTVVLQGRRGEMGIGSGIVWDSDPLGEWEECNLKGRFLTTPVPEFSLIETILWHPASGYWLLDLHLERLADSAAYFFYPLQLRDVRAALFELAASFDSGPSAKSRRVRLTLSKEGVIELVQTELPGTALPQTDPEKVLQQGTEKSLPQVVFSARNTDSGMVHLFHKTTLRRLYDEERCQQVERKGFYEVLFVNEKGEVTEGSYTNVFVEKKGMLLTPPVSCGLLPGVLRKYLLQNFPGRVVEKILTKEALQQAERVFVGNSVRGLVQVTLYSV